MNKFEIVNPTRYFVTGSNENEFTYTPGNKIFHINAGCDGYQCFNALVFANDLNHAKEILIQLCEFRIECGKKLHAYYNKEIDFYEDLSSRNAYNCGKAQAVLDAAHSTDFKSKFKQNTLYLTIQEAPLNQFYKVSWACNDNLLG